MAVSTEAMATDCLPITQLIAAVSFNDAPYDPLPPRSIRLFRLNPSSSAPSDNHEIAVFPLSACPTYNALSYCWGTAPRDLPLLCNGYTINITPTVLEALDALKRGRLKDGIDCEWVRLCSLDSNLGKLTFLSGKKKGFG